MSSTGRRISGVGQSFSSKQVPCPGSGKAQNQVLRRFCALRWNSSLWAAQLSIRYCGSAPLIHYLRPQPCMWPTARSLMTWVLLHNETHLLHARSAGSFQASTMVEQDCSAYRLIYLFIWGLICIFSACAYSVWNTGWTSIFYSCTWELILSRMGVHPSEPGCTWLLPLMLQLAAATELPPFFSLKNFRGIWILGVNCFSAEVSDVNFESRNIDIAMCLLSRLLLGSPHGLNNTISWTVPDPHCLGNLLYRCCATLTSL